MSTVDDVRAVAALVPLGVEGAIVGKALYSGAFTLAEALEATR
jgi:phosphoribosylanthranilate isomerase